MDLKPEMLNYNLEKKKENVKQKISNNDVKISNNQVMLAEIRNERVRIKSAHEKEMARIKTEENLALAKIEASNEQEILKIKTRFALEYKKADDTKQLKLAHIFERMFNTQIKSQDEKDVALANQVVQGLLAFYDRAEETLEKNVEFIQKQINKYEEILKTATGFEKSDAKEQRDYWKKQYEKQQKAFEKQKDTIQKSIDLSSQKFRGGNLMLTELVSAISNNNSQLSADLGFNRIPEIEVLEFNNEKK